LPCPDVDHDTVIPRSRVTLANVVARAPGSHPLSMAMALSSLAVIDALLLSHFELL
jgi:hypothetical protein